MKQSDSTGLDLTLVLIEVVGGQATEAALQALAALGVDCLVMLREPRPALEASFPKLRFEILKAPVPLRRMRAAQLVQTELLLLIEDNSLPQPALLAGIERAFSDEGCAAASGPVEIAAKLSARYQALACTEYGRFRPGAQAKSANGGPREVERLPGNQLGYRRADLLRALEGASGAGLLEGEIHARLLASGAKLLLVPEMAVVYAAEDPYGAALRTRYQHGRIYAGTLAANKHAARRTLQALKSLLLPAVLSLRAIRHMLQIPSIERRLSVAAWIVLLELFWSAGELQGSLFGKPADLGSWR